MGKDSSSFDYFGVGVDWNYRGSDKQKTAAGVIMTLIFFGLTFYSIITISLTLFNKEDPEVTKSIFFESDPPQVIVSPEDFSFAVGLQDPYTYLHFIDESVYRIVGEYQTFARTLSEDGEEIITPEFHELEMERCTLDHFGKNRHMFEGLALQNLLCPSLSQDLELVLQGVWESPEYKTIDFQVFPCVNSTDSDVVCKSEEEIEYQLEGAYFAIHFADQSVDPENHKNPQVSFRNTYFSMVTTRMFSVIYFSIRHMTIDTDTGILFPVMNRENMIGYEGAFHTSSFVAENYGYLMHFKMKVSSQVDSYQRRYPKLTLVLAEITGLLETYIIFIMFILTPIQRFQFKQKFAQDHFVVSNRWFQNNTKKQIKDEHIYYAPVGNQRRKSQNPEEAYKEPDEQEAVKVKVQDERKEQEGNKISDGNIPNIKQGQPKIKNKFQAEVPSSKSNNLNLQQASSTVHASLKQNRENFLNRHPGDDEKSQNASDIENTVKMTENQFFTDQEDQVNSPTHLGNYLVHESKEVEVIERIEDKGLELNTSGEKTKENKTSEIQMNNPDQKLQDSKQPITQASLLSRLHDIEDKFHEDRMIECKFTTCDFIKSFFGWRCAKAAKSKQMVFDMSCKSLDDVLDIEEYYITKREVKLLKYLLLNTEQMEVFEKIMNRKIDISKGII